MYIEDGARPAFNLNLSSVLFSSEIQSNQYKLTLKDSNLSISVSSEKSASRDGDVVTVPYTISGLDKQDGTKAYVMVTDKAYSESGVKVLQYTALTVGAESDTGTFTLDSSIIGTWGTDYHVYLLAVNEGGEMRTDYASTPVEIEKEPAAEEAINVVGVVVWNDNDNVSSDRPDKVTVHLTANGEKRITREVSPGSNGIWAFSFDALPPRDSQGNEITYSVTADEVSGYTLEVIPNGESAFHVEYTLPSAVTTYPLWVGGTQVTDRNRSDLETNHWSYSAETHTLTLKNFNENARGHQFSTSAAAAVYYNGQDDLTISLIGTNRIIMPPDCPNDCGIVSANDDSTVTFTGTGSLTIARAGDGYRYYYDAPIVCSGSVAFNSGSFNVGDTNHPNYGVNSPSVTIGTGVSSFDAKGYSGAFSGQVQNAAVGVGYYDQGGKAKADVIDIHETPVSLKYTPLFGPPASYKEVSFPRSQFTLEFDPNGGSGKMDSWTVTEGETITLPECGFDPPEISKQFSRWDVTGVDLIGTPGTELLIARNCLLGGKITAEARWVDKTEAMAVVKPEGNDLTYNGALQELVTQGVPWRGTMMFVIGDSDEQAPDSGWSESIPKGTAAGTYNVWFMVKSTVSGTTDSKPECVVAEIKKKPLTVTAASQEWTYDGLPHTNDAVTVTAGELLNGDTMVAAATGKVINVADTAEGNNPVAAGFKVMRGDTDVTENYVITPVAGTLTINKANAAAATVAANNRTYDGTEKPLVTVDDSTLVGGEMQYALGTATAATEPYTTSIPTATDAGTYYVWYKVVGDENHNDTEPELCISTILAEISATVTFKVVNGSWDDGAAADKTVVLRGYEGDLLKLSPDQIPEAGSIPNEGYRKGAWDIQPAPSIAIIQDTVYTYTYSEAIAEPVARSLTYNGLAQELVIPGDERVQYALGTDAVTAPEKSAYSASIPTATDAGIYYVWYRYTEDVPVTGDVPETGEITDPILSENEELLESDAPSDSFSVPDSVITTEDLYTVEIQDAAGTDEVMPDMIVPSDEYILEATGTQEESLPVEVGVQEEPLPVPVEVQEEDLFGTDAVQAEMPYAEEVPGEILTGDDEFAEDLPLLTEEIPDELLPAFGESSGELIPEEIEEEAGSSAFSVESSEPNEIIGLLEVVIGKASITITAEDMTSEVGDEIRALTYKVGGDYVDGDDLGVVLNTSADKNSQPGVYPITVSWNGNSNYEAVLTDGSYVIKEKTQRDLFDDVTDPSEFFYDYVYWAKDNGIVTGYPDNTFRPYAFCHRAAVVTFLWRLAGRPDYGITDAFPDMTGNSDFDHAITWAAAEGITTGYKDGTFRPWASCHKAAIVTFIWRYVGRPEPTSMASFSDMTGNDDFNKAISWAAEKGITTGYDDGTFRPWNPCLRLAVVSFLYRYAHL